jgi:twinkle protein
MLSKVKRFAQHFECHVWFVAHPRTQRAYGAGSTTLSAPSMYDISGSAHFINKADNGIVIHRPYTGTAAVHEGKDIRLTQILVRKVRNKVAGSIGHVMLSYDKATGRYVDVPS